MMAKGNKSKYIMVLIDVIIFIAVLAVTLCFAFNAFDSLKPFHRGFFCDDETLMYPYHEDTVSSTLLAALGIIIFPVLVLSVECLNALTRRVACRQYFNEEMTTMCYSTIGMYLFGGALTQLIVETMKLFVGRLRPHFHDGCKPSFGSIENCTSSGYVTNYVCTASDADIVIDVRKSFPSGHASSASYMVLYLVIYLDIAVRKRWSVVRLICPIIQIAFIVSAIYVCVSRLQDNKHHPEDVIGGALIGVIGCLTTAFIMSDIRKVNLIMDDGPDDTRATEQRNSYKLTNGNQQTSYSSNEDVYKSHDNQTFHSSVEILNVETGPTENHKNTSLNRNSIGDRY